MSLAWAISQALCVLDKIALGHNHEYFDLSILLLTTDPGAGLYPIRCIYLFIWFKYCLTWNIDSMVEHFMHNITLSRIPGLKQAYDEKF